jgi:iron complex transport system ATP-binding protein
MSEPLVRAASLSFAYGTRPVFSGVSLELRPGRMAALIGPNGSGKSTLIRLLTGHLRGKGRIEFEGVPLERWGRRKLARRVAYLPQLPTYDAAQTVNDVLRLGRAPYWSAFGLETQHDLDTVARIASQLELGDLLARPMDALSGGQRQRVFIGRCLVQEPAMLYLDEPNTFLDLRHQVDLLKLLQNLAHEHGLGVFMASHDLNLAGAFADELMLLAEGELQARGTPAEVLQAERISRAYGVPMQEVAREGGAPLLAPQL